MADTAGIKFPLDPDLDWVTREGVPVVEGHAVDLPNGETAPSARETAKRES